MKKSIHIPKSSRTGTSTTDVYIIVEVACAVSFILTDIPLLFVCWFYGMSALIGLSNAKLNLKIMVANYTR